MADVDVVSRDPGAPSRDGLEAALERAGVTAPAPAGAPPSLKDSLSSGAAPAAPPPPPALSPEEAGRQVMATVEYVTVAALQVYARTRQVAWSEELGALVRLTPEEKAALSAYAPAAYPMLHRLVAASPYVGAGLFGLGYVVLLAGKMSIIKARSPAGPSAVATPPPQAATPTGTIAPPAPPAA